MTKRLYASIIIALLALLLSGCGSGSSGSRPDTGPSQAETMQTGQTQGKAYFGMATPPPIPKPKPKPKPKPVPLPVAPKAPDEAKPAAPAMSAGDKAAKTGDAPAIIGPGAMLSSSRTMKVDLDGTYRNVYTKAVSQGVPGYIKDFCEKPEEKQDICIRELLITYGWEMTAPSDK